MFMRIIYFNPCCQFLFVLMLSSIMVEACEKTKDNVISDKERHAMNVLARFRKAAFLNAEEWKPENGFDLSKMKDVRCVLPFIEKKGKVKSLFYRPVILENGNLKLIKVKRLKGIPYTDKSKGKLKIDGKVVGIQPPLKYSFNDADNKSHDIPIDRDRLYEDKYYLLKLFVKEILPFIDTRDYNYGHMGAFIEMHNTLKPNEALPRYVSRTSFDKQIKRLKDKRGI